LFHDAVKGSKILVMLLIKIEGAVNLRKLE